MQLVFTQFAISTSEMNRDGPASSLFDDLGRESSIGFTSTSHPSTAA